MDLELTVEGILYDLEPNTKRNTTFPFYDLSTSKSVTFTLKKVMGELNNTQLVRNLTQYERIVFLKLLENYRQNVDVTQFIKRMNLLFKNHDLYWQDRTGHLEKITERPPPPPKNVWKLGGDNKQKNFSKTTQKAFAFGKERIIYIGSRGGKYVKVKQEFKRLPNRPKTQ